MAFAASSRISVGFTWKLGVDRGQELLRFKVHSSPLPLKRFCSVLFTFNSVHDLLKCICMNLVKDIVFFFFLPLK